MANPQIENGFTKIANELLWAFPKIRIPGEARQMLDLIICKTYGFNKKMDWISLPQFVKGTGVKKPNVIRALDKLISMNIVIKKDNANQVFYGINKDFTTWKPLSKKITLSKKIITVIEKDNEALSKKIPTKENITKENNTTDNIRGECLSLFEKNQIREQRDENKLRQTMTNHLSKKLFDRVFDCWEPNRRGNRFKSLKSFNTHVNTNDKKDLYDFEIAFNFYAETDEVKRGVIMQFQKFCEVWRNWYKQAIEKNWSISSIGGSYIEDYDEERQVRAI